MSVFQNQYGKWYYSYRHNGIPIRGTCTDCRTRRQAEIFEKQIKASRKIELEQIDQKKYHEQKILELTEGTEIRLVDAFDKAMQKPMRRVPCDRRMKSKKKFFADFVSFIEIHDPTATKIQHIRKTHAEDYIAYIRQNGRFVKQLEYTRNGKPIKGIALANRLSAATLNEIHTTCKQVFELLKSESGMTENPFDFDTLPRNSETRDIFTYEEVKAILESNDEFATPLFTIALYTGLRLGDIASLKWTEIDLDADCIRKRQNKTNQMVSIPIVPPFRPFLIDLYEKRTDDYVLPQHHDMYIKNPFKISYRIKRFLEGLGITTTKEIAGRARAMSVKDIHSCRHTFASICGSHGVELAVVQSVLGHMTPAMTEHYMRHATEEQKRKALEAFGYGSAKKLKHGLKNFVRLQESLKHLNPHNIGAIVRIINDSISLKDLNTICTLAFSKEPLPITSTTDPQAFAIEQSNIDTNE